MREIVFLLEEASAKAMLESLLPRLLKDGTEFRCITFEGKQDLEKQLARKIRNYQKKPVRFIVLRDQDSDPDCKHVKSSLLNLCNQSEKADKCRVRIACRELEAFYLADLHAVEKALGVKGISQKQNSRRFRSPDKQENPSRLLASLTKNKYRKIAGSRAIGRYLDLKNQRSPSFQNLVAAIVDLEKELIPENPRFIILGTWEIIVNARITYMKVHTLCDGIRRFGSLSLVNQVLAIETVLALLLARMITGFVPARYWLRWLHTEAEMQDVPYTPGCKEIDQPPSIVDLQTEIMYRGQPARNVVKAQSGSFDPALPPRLGRAVAKVARYLPINARCLQQAMATQWILKRRGVHSILVLGVRRNINANHDFQYHAWLTVDGRPVIGGEEAESYKTFPTFSLRKKNVRKVARTLSE